MNSTVTTLQTLTPLMQQYMGIKNRFPDEIVFFRLGDFYEMFFEDAIKAAPLLEVALTKRQNTPMCGVPYHAAPVYMAKLLKAGLSVAVAEQLEDPKKTKGMVKRDVVRVITPGTILEQDLLPSKKNNFLVALSFQKAVHQDGFSWGLAAADVSTGALWVGEIKNDFHLTVLKSHLMALDPSEILMVGDEARVALSRLNFKGVLRLEPVPADAAGLSPQALSALRRYLMRDREGAVPLLREPLQLPAEKAGIMFLDETAIRHLELVESSDSSKKGPTLLSVIDQTVTPGGGRQLRWWLLHPSIEISVIEKRLNCVDELFQASLLREELRSTLHTVADIERISVRAHMGTATPRDLASLRQSLSQIPLLQKTLLTLKDQGTLSFDGFLSRLDVPEALVDVLNTQLMDEPPIKLDQGGVIQDGVNVELDELRALRKNSRRWIADMEAEEKEKTGITTLKVGYTDIFGYYLEVTRSHIAKVPPSWIRKQTLTNAERYITPELKVQEEKILGAEEKILNLERALFEELVHQVAVHVLSLERLATVLAELDALASLAMVASVNGYVRPEIDESDALFIQGGRHPVIEKHIGKDRFIPNDLSLGTEFSQTISLITGPNMAGKSTYLRQTALMVIMAQMGSFIPAVRARVGLVDRIFTRIGATDRLAQGYSTFMVEMQEVASLLQYATPQSLLILDEVGRGTSTYDGVSIAWSVVDHLATATRQPSVLKSSQSEAGFHKSPRTLFATHYFELTQLPTLYPGVTNAHATAKEWVGADGQKQVVFLYQIQPGPADRSYGIHVADMAGLPEACIKKAREILQQLESGVHNFSSPKTASSPGVQTQLEFFADHPAVEQLKKIDVDHLTPIEALNILAALKRTL